MVRLGRDEHGLWLGMAQGSAFQKGDEAPQASPTPMVQLVVDDAWWTLLYNGPAHRYLVYVDVITPPVWVTDARVEMVDLDLDVVQRSDGRVEVIDRDEFDEHQVTLGYPSAWVEAAERTAVEVADRLEAGAPPFGARMRAWHAFLTGDGPAPV